jgi:hypothetical protein
LLGGLVVTLLLLLLLLLLQALLLLLLLVVATATVLYIFHTLNNAIDNSVGDKLYSHIRFKLEVYQIYVLGKWKLAHRIGL